MCVCVYVCERGEEGGGEQRERERETKGKHTRCDDRWRPILPISGSQDL